MLETGFERRFLGLEVFTGAPGGLFPDSVESRLVLLMVRSWFDPIFEPVCWF